MAIAPIVRLVIVVGLALVTRIDAHGQADAACDRLTPSDRRSTVMMISPEGMTPVDAWFLYAKGRPPAGQPPRLCDPREGDCLEHSKIPADSAPFELLGTFNGWSCIERSGPGTMWVRSENVKAVVPDIRPLVSAWVGRWVQGDGYINVTSTDGQQLKIEGENKWYGNAEVVHYGSIAFDVIPTANPLTLVNDGCEVTATLIGDYLLLHDNMGCGGANVRFQGAWKRSTRRN